MTRFDPPGFLDDFTEAEKERWSATVSGWLDRARAGNPAGNDGPRGQFFNALTNPPAGDAQVAVISWNAFPRQVKANSLSDAQRWRRADADRNVQDEYCEWSVTRDPVTRQDHPGDFHLRGTGVLEGSRASPIRTRWSRSIASSSRRAVTQADLFADGVYNPYNRFNNSTSNGAMHLIQAANTLYAEIELGAAATIRRAWTGARSPMRRS